MLKSIKLNFVVSPYNNLLQTCGMVKHIFGVVIDIFNMRCLPPYYTILGVANKFFLKTLVKLNIV